MLLKKPGLILVSLILLSSAYGQQDPQFSQIMFSQNTINPGAAGSSDMISSSLINRIQWVGFDGAPKTSALNVNAAVAPFGFKSGVGTNIYTDNYGFNKDLGINLSYAARLKTGKGMLGIGIYGGFISKNINPSWSSAVDKEDDAIPQKKESSLNLDLGAGLYFNNEEMYFGLSVAHLNGTKMNGASNPAHYKRQFYLTGGYILNLPNPSWQFNPSVYAVSDLFLSQISLSANIKYNKKFWGGVSYRMGHLGAIGGMLGIELFNGLKIGYAYEFSMRELSGYNDGSHEFMLGYTFSLKKERPPQQYKSIRFL